MTAPAELLNEALTVEQFCVFAGISYDMWQKLRKRGEGPPEVRIGNSPRVLRSDAYAWLESLRTSRPAPKSRPVDPPATGYAQRNV